MTSSSGGALAAVLVVGALVIGGAAAFAATRDWGSSSADEPTSSAAPAPTEETESAAEPADDAPEASPPAAPKKATAGSPRSLDDITWTTDAPSTLAELARTWSMPGDLLASLNPDVDPDQTLPAGTRIVVHGKTEQASISVGPPNDGRLIYGVPLPEGEAWAMPEDRSRAFATDQTIAAITAALDAYHRRYPDAEPIQMGELSARRGGELSGHQSHQSGRDVDIRLVTDASADGFDAERNWFLVRTLIDDNDVRNIFLNQSEQGWLREAADADVGAEAAERYFVLINHEPGHNIHMHVRFGCAEQDKRCVAYSMPEAGEDEAKLAKLPSTKLPVKPRGSATRGPSKLPTSGRPRRPSTPTDSPPPRPRRRPR